MKSKNIDLLNDEKMGKNKTILLMISIIFVLVIIVIIITKIFILTPKNIFLYSLNNTYYNLKNKINVDSSIDLSKYQTIISNTSLNINIGAKNKLLNELISNNKINNLNINVNDKLDIKNNILNSNIDLFNSDEKVSLNLYKDSDYLYILLNNIYEEYLKIPFLNKFNLSNMKSINSNDIKIFLNNFKDVYLENISDKDFTISKEMLLINDENIKTNKISYNISSIELNRILKETLDKSSNIDNEFKNVVLNLNKYLEDNKYSFILNTYTYGLIPETIKYSLEIIDDNKKYVIDYSDYSNIYSIGFNSNNKNTLKLNINNYGRSEYNLNLEFNDYKIDFNINLNNNDITFNYKIEYLDSLLSGKNKIYDISLVDNNYNFKTKSDIVYNKYDEDVFKINIDGNSKYIINEPLTSIDINNNVNIYDLSNEEMNNIVNKLLSNELINKVYITYLEYKLRYD